MKKLVLLLMACSMVVAVDAALAEVAVNAAKAEIPKDDGLGARRMACDDDGHCVVPSTQYSNSKASKVKIPKSKITLKKSTDELESKINKD